MQLIRQGGLALAGQKTALALGYFDGVHQGHAAVIGAAVRYAKEHDLCPAVFTFLREPWQGFEKKQILSHEQKQAALAALGVEICFEPEFESFHNLTPRQFFESYLVEKYRAKALFCGENYGFGAKRAGGTELLAELCREHDLSLQVFSLSRENGETISSSRIRAALAEGDVAQANKLLSRVYELCLPVQHGQGLGRSFGFPTINQILPPKRQTPAFGVYITSSFLEGRWYPSVTGYGTRPTVNGEGVTCETFIPGYEGDVYGQCVCVRFHQYLAPSKKFACVEDLAKAVHTWAEQALRYFSA